MREEQLKKLPRTAARLATSITIEVKRGDEANYREIGAAERLEISSTRAFVRRREFGSDPPGVTVEIVPGASEISLTLRRVILYRGSLVEALGLGTFEDLIYQSIPFHIRVKVWDPRLPDEPIQTLHYEECYITDLPREYDLTGDFIVVEEVGMVVGRVYSEWTKKEGFGYTEKVERLEEQKAK